MAAGLLAFCAVCGFVLGFAGAPQRGRLPGEAGADGTNAPMVATEARPLNSEELAPPTPPEPQAEPEKAEAAAAAEKPIVDKPPTLKLPPVEQAPPPETAAPVVEAAPPPEDPPF